MVWSLHTGLICPRLITPAFTSLLPPTQLLPATSPGATLSHSRPPCAAEHLPHACLFDASAYCRTPFCRIPTTRDAGTVLLTPLNITTSLHERGRDTRFLRATDLGLLYFLCRISFLSHPTLDTLRAARCHFTCAPRFAVDGHITSFFAPHLDRCNFAEHQVLTFGRAAFHFLDALLYRHAFCCALRCVRHSVAFYLIAQRCLFISPRGHFAAVLRVVHAPTQPAGW